MKQWNFWQNLLFVLTLFAWLICVNVIANLIVPPIY